MEGNGPMVPTIVAGWEIGFGETVSSWLWAGDVGGVCIMVVVPSFCGVVSSSMITVDWSCTRGSSRIWMMAGVDGEVNGVEILVHVRGGVICN
jgi:hypothetical protein